MSDRQLRDVRRDPPCLVLREQLGRNVRFTSESGHSLPRPPCPLCADFVAEVGGDTRVAVVTNFLK
jgi:hypothetical protein